MGCKKSLSSRLPPLAPPQENPKGNALHVVNHRPEIHRNPRRCFRSDFGVIPAVPNPFKKAKMSNAFAKQLLSALQEEVEEEEEEGSEKLFGVKKQGEEDMELQDLLDHHELNEILLQWRQRTAGDYPLLSSPQFSIIKKKLSHSDIDRTLTL